MRITTSIAVAGLTVAALAAVPVGAAHHEAAEPMTDVFMGGVVQNIEDTEKKLIALAEAMPADMYGWAPSVDVRTFSETYIHVAAANLLLPSALGAAPPEGMEMGDNAFAAAQAMEAEITAKEDVIAKVQESFAYLYSALPTLTDLEAEVTLFGPPSSKRSYVFIILGHAHEHLGQAIAYARSVGVTPPWSQPPPEEAAVEDAPGDTGSGEY
ncbi:MAG: DinB family protein [Acidobacteriota bacterium]|nr:DinB family protein [Acidobacteriota bacterium]